MLAYSASLRLRRSCRLRPATSQAGGSASRRLLGSIIALALGLAAVAASLSPFAGGLVDVSPNHSKIGVAWIVPAGEELMASQAVIAPRSRSALLTEAFAQHDAAPDPSLEPLDQQSGAMASARPTPDPLRDGREFLLRMASRLHAPAAAYTTGWQPTPPPCCPR